MASIRQTIVSGFNELVQSIKGAAQQYPEQKHFISFISFNSNGIKTHHDCAAVEELKEIDASRYNPDNMTPLYDAVGFGITRLQTKIGSIENRNVLVTIMTDGMENDSREYSFVQIKALIEQLKQERWTFTYIGADHNVEEVAQSLSISNSMKFDKDEQDMQYMFEKERYARQEYLLSIKEKVYSAEMDYFSEDKGFRRFLSPNKQYFQTALNEIRSGRKTGHWMWFMFPQIQGLGHSETSKLYAIRNLDEAYMFSREYPTGKHIIMLCKALLELPENDATVIFGDIDAMKLRSSMTLFSMTPNANPIFQEVLDKFFNGEKDAKTIEIIKNQ
jgi:uncharacterized protein (DUF1810 family)